VSYKYLQTSHSSLSELLRLVLILLIVSYSLLVRFVLSKGSVELSHRYDWKAAFSVLGAGASSNVFSLLGVREIGTACVRNQWTCPVPYQYN